MPARSQKRRARPMNAPWTPPESPRCAPRPPGLGADRWLLAAETLPTHQKFVLHRVSGEKEFLMRWPYIDIRRSIAATTLCGQYMRRNGKGGKLVGAEGFEPSAFCSRSKRATRLRYAPTAGIFAQAVKTARSIPKNCPHDKWASRPFNNC